MPLPPSKRGKKAESRRVSKMDTFGRNGEHPTRANPQVYKTVTTLVSFFKTLTRVYKFFETNDERPNREGTAKGLKLMPYMNAHYKHIRGDIHTAQHRKKEPSDATATERDTAARYKPPYPHPRLIRRKKAEVMYAVEVLKNDKPVTIREVLNRLGTCSDDEIAGIVKYFDGYGK